MYPFLLNGKDEGNSLGYSRTFYNFVCVKDFFQGMSSLFPLNVPFGKSGFCIILNFSAVAKEYIKSLYLGKNG